MHINVKPHMCADSKCGNVNSQRWFLLCRLYQLYGCWCPETETSPTSLAYLGSFQLKTETEMLTLIDGFCCVGFTNSIGVGVLRQRLALRLWLTWVASNWRRRQNLVSGTFYFKYKTGWWITSRTVKVILIYHRHKPTDSIKL
jgi:hypothetical protein